MKCPLEHHHPLAPEAVHEKELIEAAKAEMAVALAEVRTELPKMVAEKAAKTLAARFDEASTQSD